MFQLYCLVLLLWILLELWLWQEWCGGKLVKAGVLKINSWMELIFHWGQPLWAHENVNENYVLVRVLKISGLIVAFSENVNVKKTRKPFFLKILRELDPKLVHEFGLRVLVETRRLILGCFFIHPSTHNCNLFVMDLTLSITSTFE